MRIKILVRRNLKLTPGKQSAQCVHAALALYKMEPRAYHSCVVLEVSDKKFQEAISSHSLISVVEDAGYTEVSPGTRTALAFYEEDPRKS